MVLDLNGMEGPEVDEALGVADAFDTVVDGWEAGTIIPTVDDVRRLATLTGYAPRWFYLPDPETGVGFLCGDDGCEVVGKPADEPRPPKLRSV